jgi:radical SAM-linked protein
MIDELKKKMPEGAHIYEARTILTKSPSLSSTVNRAVYLLPLTVWDDPDRLGDALTELLARPELMCERTRKNDTRMIDIRPAVHGLVLNGDHLRMVLGMGEKGYARPPEVVRFLADGLNTEPAALSFHRAEVYHQDDFGRKTDAMDL